MLAELWDQFTGLVNSNPGLLATVTAHNADVTSSLTTYDGAQMQALGGLGELFRTTYEYRMAAFLGRLPNPPLTEIFI